MRCRILTVQKGMDWGPQNREPREYSRNIPTWVFIFHIPGFPIRGPHYSPFLLGPCFRASLDAQRSPLAMLMAQDFSCPGFKLSRVLAVKDLKLPRVLSCPGF